MSKLCNGKEHALMALLRRTALADARGAPAEPALELGEDPSVDPRDAALDDEGCEDLDAPHDLAALHEGHLSPEGVQRLAGHVMRCESCRIVVTGLVAEFGPAEATGTHRAVPARRTGERLR